ncbi:MAG: hypothetical protein WCY37_01300 [Candidatus Dojkabacteria bacterium]
MPRYEALVNKLLLESPQDLPDNTYLLSVYVDTHGRSRSQVETYIKSHLREAFFGTKNLGDRHDIVKNLTKTIENKLDSFNSFARGLGIFAKFSLDGEVEDVDLANLHRSPETEAHVGKAYDLDQLIWIDHVTKDSLVLNVQINDARVYVLRGTELVLEKMIDYEIEEEAREFVQEYSPIQGKGDIYHGTGGSNKEREREEFLKMLFNQVLDFVKENYAQELDVDYILIFYSMPFDFISDDMISMTKGMFGFDPIAVQRNISSKSELENHSEEVIRKFEGELKKELLEYARSDNDIYAKGWKEVCDASNFAKIRDLFITIDASKQGYVKDNGLIYTYPTRGSKKIQNIAPRLVKRTLEQGGNIRVFRDEKILEAPISAKLRYKK